MSSLIQYLKRARGDAALRQVERNLMREISLLRAAVEGQQRLIAQLTSGSEVRGLGARTSTDVTAWEARAQPGELAFHKRPNVRSGGQWEKDTARKWGYAGLGADDYAGKLIVDVGAGSRLRTLYFKGARIAAIEPLAERFIAEVEWEDLSKADELYAVPAEKDIPELHGRADLLVSINALDHGFDFEQAIRNLRRYLADDGRAFLSFDQHEQPDEMHPLILNAEIVDAILDDAGFEIERFEAAGRYHGGPGLPALNYWLRPRISS
jgi:hypothetical protein